MVFESYVVDLLNKYAGQYLENLDTSQLRLGIWGGDVKLENLILKESALDDLDLPVKVLRGHLGRLVLKIPWKSLYSEPVIANIDGLYLLVRPNTGLKYNAEKEEKAKQEKKKRQLDAVELAKQLEEEKKKTASAKDDKSDSFAEKFAMHVVKNLQISICNIHVRYEDDVTNPLAPFSIGVTLENLSAKSTDANWVPTVLGSAVQIVHKLVQLDSLSLYWNRDDKVEKLPTQEQWVNIAKSGIASTKDGHHTPKGFRYILQPISATSKVKMDTKPGSDLSSPKVYLSLVLQEIAIVLQRHQYHDIMELLESFDRMSRNTAFRKYRPNVPLHKHAREWWSYGINSILEEDVKRRYRNWSWSHMKKHRATCAEYKKLYKQKLLQDKISDSMLKALEDLENELDILNITICRQQVEYEEAAALKKKKNKAEEKKNSGWFSGLWGSGKKQKKAGKGKSEILTEAQEKEELDKLYSAIGYSENEVITAFPKEYVENKVVVHLRQIAVVLRDDSVAGRGDVVRLSLKDLYADLSQRPSAQAIRVTAKVDMMKMFGSAGGDDNMPLMVSSQDDNSGGHIALFRAAFETNPLDGKCDQRVEVFSQPVRIVYDANTLDQVVNFFKPPQNVHLQELSAAAHSRLNDLKSVSKASLAYALEHHKITDVNIDVKSPYIIIPENGRLDKCCSVLLVDLGHVKITSDPEQERFQAKKELSREDLEAKSYDKFDFRLEALQVLIAEADENWELARKQKQTKLHILDPMELSLKVQKSLNPDDLRFAQIKVSGSLPSIIVHVSDKKFHKVLKLAMSIPIPGGDETVDQIGRPQDVRYEGRSFVARETHPSAKTLSVMGTSGAFNDDEDEETFSTPPASLDDDSKLLAAKTEAKEILAQQIKVAVDFHIEQVSVDVTVCDEAGNDVPCLSLAVRSLGTDVYMHPWDLSVSASLGSLSLHMMNHGPEGGPLDIVKTPEGAQLLTVSYIKVDMGHPKYRTDFRSTEQSVQVEFTSLNVALHQEALLEIMQLSATFLPPSENIPAAVSAKLSEALPDASTDSKHALGTVSKNSKKESVQLEIKAKLGGIFLHVSSADGDLTQVIVGGLAAHVAVMNDRTNISASMKDLAVLDSTPGALYPKIVSIVNQEVFNVEIVMFNDATSGSNFRNMEAADIKFRMSIGCIRAVFLNRFVLDLLAFLNKFQSATEAVKHASKTAAESATATIQSYQSQSSRVTLSVSIQAPLIIIPVSSTSQHALVANLGLLTVSNSFNLASAGTDVNGSDAVIVDNMVVELTSVQLARGNVKGGEDIETICNILEPFKLSVYVARNLSPWYRKLPDIDVIGKLHTVQIGFGQEDIKTVMAVLSENLTEGHVTEPEPVMSEQELKSIVQNQFFGERQNIDDTNPDSSEEKPREPTTPGGTAWDMFKFSFDIEQVCAAVFLSQNGAASSDRGSCLGEFSLVRVAASGRMKSDSSLTAIVVLESCLLDDKRSESEAGVTRMIDCHVTGDPADAPKMITVNYEQSINQDKRIEVNVCSVHVVVNLEFLLVLSNVFTSALSTETPSTLLSTSVDAPATQAKVPGPSDQEPPELSFELSVKDPEIVLLADAKDKNTNALFMKNAVSFMFFQSQGQQKMTASVTKLSVISAAFDKDRRESTKCMVLQLSQLSLVSSAPEGGHMHVDIRSSPAHLHVSPPTIRTVTACLVSMSPSKGAENENQSEEEGSSIWDEKPIEIKDRWYLTPVAEDKLVAGRRVYMRQSKGNKYEPGLIIQVIASLMFVKPDSFPMPSFVDCNDVTAVVVDRLPVARELKSGTKIIAKEPEGSLFVEGSVIRTEEVDKQLSCLVRYTNGQEHWTAVKDVRVMLLNRSAVSEGQVDVSSIVFARCKNEKYRKGYVSSKESGRLFVRLYGGDYVRLSMADVAGVVLDKTPRDSDFYVGSPVLATYDMTRYNWNTGHIVEIVFSEDAGARVYRVRFDDGNDGWMYSMDSMRVLPTRRKEVPAGVLSVGTVVWARTSKTRYDRAFIVRMGAKMQVELYDGTRVSYDMKDATHLVLPDIAPKVGTVQVGARVISRLKNVSGYHTGAVAEVDTTKPSEPLYLVTLDGGNNTWTNLYHLRLLQKEVHLDEESVATQAVINDDTKERGELMLFNMESFDIKIEDMSGGQIIPLLAVDGQVQAQVKDWSTKLSAQAEITVGATYFNENVSEWEPLLEPVEDKKKGYRPWELTAQFSMGSDSGPAESAGDNAEPDVSSEPAMSLDVGSKDVLQLTVTKSALNVFSKLGSAFGKAVSSEGMGVLRLEDAPPYEICNELGIKINIRLSSDFQKPSSADSNRVLPLAAASSVRLRMTSEYDRRSSRYVRDPAGSGPSIGVEVDGYHEVKTISVKQARTVLQNIIPKQIESVINLPEFTAVNEMVLVTFLGPPELLSGAHLSVVIQVESTEGQKVVTIRSPLQLKNHFPIPLNLLCKKEKFTSGTTILPHEVYNVPLVLAYKAGLYLQPAEFCYGETSVPLMWNELAPAGHAQFSCPPPAGEGPPFYIQVNCEKAVYTAVHGMARSMPTYMMHLYPSVVLHNYLPYNLYYAMEGIPFTELKGGIGWPLFSSDLSKKIILHLQLDGYQENNWRGDIELYRTMDEMTTFTLYPTLPQHNSIALDLGVLSVFNGTLNVTLYCPYWMVNKTNMLLEYKALNEEKVLVHPAALDDVVMFSFRGKKTTRVRVAGSNWSDKFSLDAVGSGGSLKVRKGDKVYEIGMQNSLSYFSLTKIVEFTPFYLLNNHMEHPISLCASADGASWVTVNPGKTAPFWPTASDLKNMALRVGDSQEMSPRFDFEPDVTVMLKIEGKAVGAVCVDMLTKDSAAILAFEPYYSGAATVRIENCTQLEICYKQDSDNSWLHVVRGGQCVLYTWDEPTTKKHFIWFAIGEETKRTTELTKAQFDSFEVDGKKFHWATFLDGLQRVLLIIDDFTIAYRAHMEQTERVSQKVTLSFHGVGLSLVNDENSTEVAYIGIQPSDIIWEEMKKKGRWKALKLRQCEGLEVAWKRVQQDLSVGKQPCYQQKVGDLEVDFQLMEIARPSRRSIRRSFTPGVFFEYSASTYQMLSAKINSIQIDSQLPGSMFQTAFHPVPPPKSLAAENAPKPFIEMSLCTKQEQHSHVNEIKYFQVLIQEMDTRVDMGFLTALMGLYSTDTIDRSQEASQYAADKKRVFDKLGDADAVQAAFSDKRNYIDELHLSPLKIHLSFSQLGGPAKDGKSKAHIGSSFINLLLQSVGVAVTEIQDVEFKLAYFEVKDKVYTQQQLTNVATKHYVSQALKQMYVLVLGLDVLGNPFALLTDLKDGARDLFYEPYQGLIQGPGEFVEGLGIGARSLLGHTVGGAAGAVSRITGTLGKGIAALTMDEKYKQDRRQAMGKKPVNLKEGLTRGGKGLFEGVVSGLTGIVTKPVEGAKDQGAAGFFKGLGKGVVGVVARPAGGLVDFASSTLEGIKGSAETGSQVKRLRPPRVFYADKIIRQYNSREAQGNAVLQEIKKSKSSLEGDNYFNHCDLNIKKTLIITNKHIIVAGKSEIFDGWECDWTCVFQDLTAEPSTAGRKLVLKVPDKGKTIFKQSQMKAIITPSPEAAAWLVTKIKQARS